MAVAIIFGDETPSRRLLILPPDHTRLSEGRQTVQEALEWVVLPLPVTTERDIAQNHFEEISELISLGHSRYRPHGEP